MDALGYVILAALGLSVLVFIHEWGHYIVARKVGMRVEVFSIGFGKPILSWMRKGVKWQIGMLPFGGYVKIAGMDIEKGKDPHEIPDGFYGKKPIHRLLVAFAGPFVNIVFALLIFTAIWAMGGRTKNFSEYTQIIGWVDPKSELYELGVKPGDTLTWYNGEPFHGIQQLLYGSITDRPESDLQGYKINYLLGQQVPFNYIVKPYPDPRQIDHEIKTVGILAPANYLIYAGGMPEDGPAKNSGIEVGDRIIWIDGEMVFSTEQLIHLVNDSRAFLTIKRDQQTLQVKVPRIPVRDLRLTRGEKDELDDWRYEAALHSRLDELVMIPFHMRSDLFIEEPYSYMNGDSTEDVVDVLQHGDQIIAVDGMRVVNGYELLDHLQNKRIQVIVERGQGASPSVSWKEEDQMFVKSVNWDDLGEVVSSLGSSEPKTSVGSVHLLNAMIPIKLKDFPLSMENITARRQALQQIENPEERAQALALLQKQEDRYVLGIPFHDLQVHYNPNPIQLTGHVLVEMKRTLGGMVTGSVSPKWLSGPVGIIHLTQVSWQKGASEAMYWMGLISLNLALLNLLPLPILDGGHISFAAFEMMTRRRVSAKMMQKIVIPFIVLFIGFFIYVTYHDLLRLLG